MSINQFTFQYDYEPDPTQGGTAHSHKATVNGGTDLNKLLEILSAFLTAAFGWKIELENVSEPEDEAT